MGKIGWLKVVFDYPALFWGFLRQDLRERYAGTFGGALWSIITPVANMLVYVFVFSVILKLRVNIEEVGTDSFVIFLICGLIPWLAFADALARAPTILPAHANLIKKISFPVEILTFVTVASSFVLNGIALLVLMVYLFFHGFMNANWLLIPFIVLLHMVFTQGMVGLLSIFGLFFRDLGNLLATLLQLWFYLTPIIYPLNMIPENYRAMAMLNPIYPFIQLYREVLLGTPVTWTYFPLIILTAAIVYYLGNSLLPDHVRQSEIWSRHHGIDASVAINVKLL